MKFSKTDLFVLIAALEHLGEKEKKIQLNEKGIRRLALIRCKITAELVPVSVKGIIESITKRMLSEIDYQE